MLSSSGLARLSAIRRPWLRTECGVELIRPKVAWARIRSSAASVPGCSSGQDLHPQLHVAALQRADLGLVLVGEVAEVLVLDPDDVGIAQGEVHLELHQPGQGRGGAAGLGHHAPAAVEQVLADAQQQGAQHGLFARRSGGRPPGR